MDILLFFIAILLLVIGFLIGCWYTKRKLADKSKMLDFGLKCVIGYKKENQEIIDRLVELEEIFQDDGGIYEEEKC